MRRETAIFVTVVIALFSLAIVANITYGLSKVDFTGLVTYGPEAEDLAGAKGEICIDSDNGRTYEQGYVSVFGSITHDYCLDDVRLQEYSCETLFRTSEVHVCPYGCSNGACK